MGYNNLFVRFRHFSVFCVSSVFCISLDIFRILLGRGASCDLALAAYSARGRSRFRLLESDQLCSGWGNAIGMLPEACGRSQSFRSTPPLPQEPSEVSEGKWEPPTLLRGFGFATAWFGLAAGPIWGSKHFVLRVMVTFGWGYYNRRLEVIITLGWGL